MTPDSRLSTPDSRTSRLIVAPNWLGDSVMSLPMLRAVRRAHPQDRLAVLARRGPADIYRADGSADEVLVRSSLAADLLRLRRKRFDEIWLLPNSFRAALLAFLSGAPRRIGYETDRRAGLLSHALPRPPATRHQLRDYDLLLKAHGIAPDFDPPRLRVPEAAVRRANEALRLAGLSEGAPLVLLCPGSASAETKRWPAARYAELADSLARQGLSCAVVVGPAEVRLAAKVTAAARSALPALGADLDSVELAALLARARVVVSNDSGPMHLAAAVGTPVVAFFGPTDPGRTAPSGSPVRVLDRYVFCSPCYLERCPYRHECMEEITVRDALRAVEELLG
ncbi:MAG TPA: lipopolysaccharide heptosyltransferase II [Thermoanaerobaculia bacterium]